MGKEEVRCSLFKCEFVIVPLWKAYPVQQVDAGKNWVINDGKRGKKTEKKLHFFHTAIVLPI